MPDDATLRCPMPMKVDSPFNKVSTEFQYNAESSVAGESERVIGTIESELLKLYPSKAHPSSMVSD